MWYWVEMFPNKIELGLAIGGGCWLFDTDFYTGTVITSGVMYSAFTVAELGELLPINKCSTRHCDQNHHGFLQHDDSWLVESAAAKIVDASEANARAEMLIYVEGGK